MSSEPYDPYIPSGQGSQGSSRDPRTAAIQNDIDKTVDKMRENIDNLAKREHNLNQLQQKTGDLADTAGNFRRSANKVRKKMWWNVSISTIPICRTVSYCVSGDEDAHLARHRHRRPSRHHYHPSGFAVPPSCVESSNSI
ncbi:hypothetical protein N657DRAFT_644110 [Parathielavia appendiculata]|uniref:V-SNARE coiled-coil homology domain-containing protein n=1 Tax=Parathielavia appendiculata TaxID=2587402 RepID=A0AAN6U332_9PEZI|nr:hypothetical protein N657DRAFT_644110 [Parathielavia appendiculata]